MHLRIFYSSFNAIYFYTFLIKKFDIIKLNEMLAEQSAHFYLIVIIIRELDQILFNNLDLGPFILIGHES